MNMPAAIAISWPCGEAHRNPGRFRSRLQQREENFFRRRSSEKGIGEEALPVREGWSGLRCIRAVSE